MQAPSVSRGDITEADKHDAVALGAWSARINPRNMTPAEYRTRVQRDFKAGMSAAMAYWALWAFDESITMLELSRTCKH